MDPTQARRRLFQHCCRSWTASTPHSLRGTEHKIYRTLLIRLHTTDRLRNQELGLRLFPYLLDGNALCQLDQRQNAVRAVDVEHAKVRDDPRDAVGAGEGERADLLDLGPAVLVRVVRRDDDLREGASAEGTDEAA